MSNPHDTHAVRWLGQVEGWGVVRRDLLGDWITHAGVRGGPRRFSTLEAAHRACLGVPPWGWVRCDVSFVSASHPVTRAVAVLPGARPLVWRARASA